MHLKIYIFHFNTPQVNLIFDWALNWPWALEFDHYWGTRAQVVKGTKCGVYNPNPLSLRLLITCLMTCDRFN